MLIKIFTLRFQTTLDAFDDTLFVEFIKDKSVLSLKEYFFQKNEIPYLALIVTYEPVQASNILGFDKSGASQKKKNDKWRTLFLVPNLRFTAINLRCNSLKLNINFSFPRASVGMPNTTRCVVGRTASFFCTCHDIYQSSCHDLSMLDRGNKKMEITQNNLTVQRMVGKWAIDTLAKV
ncbi:MAG: hypothetical protein KAH77_09155 [Thiomargarita sp.]|nr:hypothetical protein [Thiomargarita sp.]